MEQHIVSAFTDELEQLSADLLGMGGLAEAMIRDACRAVVTRDTALAQTVIDRDAELDAQETECEREVIRLLALRQPLAADLRQVIGAIKLANAIERVGDLAKNIAKRSFAITQEDNRAALHGVERMGQAVSRQLRIALDAYARGDAATAMSVVEQDDDIDSHYNALLRSMLVYMIEDPEQLDARSNFLFIVKNLERIGDHCSNIAKVVYFIATGEPVLSKAERRAIDAAQSKEITS
ncbi:MAG: phosphate signaling complex protein PhoU [Pseudomonadota bacterium]